LIFFSGLIVVAGILFTVDYFYPGYTGENLNLPSLYPYGLPPFDLNDYNITKNNTTNTTKPLQTYNFPKVNRSNVPTIGEVLNMSNAGFLYSMAAAEEEYLEP
jgi:hypothetical protein